MSLYILCLILPVRSVSHFIAYSSLHILSLLILLLYLPFLSFRQNVQLVKKNTIILKNTLSFSHLLCLFFYIAHGTIRFIHLCTMLFKQVNLQKAFAATSLFASSLQSNTIAFLTEPYHFKNKLTNLGPNFTVYPETTQADVPRAALMIPRHFPSVFLPNLSNPDCAVCLLKHANLLLVSAYFDKNNDLDQPWFRAAIQ